MGNQGETVMGLGVFIISVGNWTMLDAYVAWDSCAYKSLSKANHVASSILKSWYIVYP